VVDGSHNNSSGSIVPTRPINNSAFTCIKSGLGSSVEWAIPNRGMWSTEETSHHINYLELLAFLAIKAFGKYWQNITVLLRMDNMIAVSYINQKGGIVSKALCELAITIWTWRTEKNIILQAEHLHGQMKSQANKESRTVRDHYAWKLKQSVFQQLMATMSPLEVDLFTSHLTRQLPPCFYSWRPDPEAEATDIFMQNWATCLEFANPPWCLIHCCLT